MGARKLLIVGLCSAAAIAARGASSPADEEALVGEKDGMEVVSEESLRDMRGGMEMSNGLEGYFAIDRVVQVDGQVVAQMQIVVSNLDKLASGGMPNITVSGPLATLVQVVNGAAGGGSSTEAPASAAPTTSSEAAAESAHAAANAAVARSAPVSSESASVATGSSAAGMTPQVSNAVANAVASVLTGTGVGATQGSSSSSGIQSSVQVVPQGSAAPAVASNGSAGASVINKIIPVGNLGQFAVVSNLPNATALTTAIQNEVRGTTITTQTTITASLNSLTLLNSMALSSALQQQIKTGLPGIL